MNYKVHDNKGKVVATCKYPDHAFLIAQTYNRAQVKFNRRVVLNYRTGEDWCMESAADHILEQRSKHHDEYMKKLLSPEEFDKWMQQFEEGENQ